MGPRRRTSVRVRTPARVASLARPEIDGRLGRKQRAGRRPGVDRGSGGLAVGRREAQGEEAADPILGANGIDGREAELEQETAEVTIAAGLA